MIIAVTQFNKQRNQLELNPDLEASMLLEEIKEFWDATNVAERMDALIDTEYVWLGTKLKFSYNGKTVPKELVEGVEQAIELMEDYLMDELGVDFFEIARRAKDIVCKANALKGLAKNEEGKVLKDENYTEDATALIAEMIERVLDGSN